MSSDEDEKENESPKPDKSRSGWFGLRSGEAGKISTLEDEESKENEEKISEIVVSREPDSAVSDQEDSDSHKSEKHKKDENKNTDTSNKEKMSDDEITDNVSADLTEEDKKEIRDAIETIRKKLSFAKDFSDDERSGLMRLGQTGRDFVGKALGLVKKSPGILPRSFNVDEFRRDAELYEELGGLGDELTELAERISDTEAAVGSDAFTAALVVYQSGKLARVGDEMDNHLSGWRRKLANAMRD